jgi:ankyrin repeat protein
VINYDRNPPQQPVFRPIFGWLKSYTEVDTEILIATFVRLLMEHGADLNIQDRNHTTPLHLSIQENMFDLTRVLLFHGAVSGLKNNDGKTPLHLLLEEYHNKLFFGGNSAYEEDFPSLARSLLVCGADINAQDLNYATPLWLAMEWDMYDIARVLLELGADLNLKDNKGKTLLHLLLERNHKDYDDVNDILVVERLLLERGADVNAQDEDNITPLQLAYSHPKIEIAQIILDHANAGKFGASFHLRLDGEYYSYERISVFHMFF